MVRKRTKGDKDAFKRFLKERNATKSEDELLAIRLSKKRTKSVFKKTGKARSLNDFERADSRRNDVAKTELTQKVVENSSKPHFSIGEKVINRFLTSKKIKFKKEATLPGCVNPKTGNKLFFDFYLVDYNIVIEYDGYQHRSKPKGMSKKDFEQGLFRDRVKDKYCEDRGIKMIRIPSTEKHRITDVMERILLENKIAL